MDIKKCATRFSIRAVYHWVYGAQPWSAEAALRLSPDEAALRRPRLQPCCGLTKRAHGLRTPNLLSLRTRGGRIVCEISRSCPRRRRDNWLHNRVQPRFTTPTVKEAGAHRRTRPAADQCETEPHAFVQSFFTPSPMGAHRLQAQLGVLLCFNATTKPSLGNAA